MIDLSNRDFPREVRLKTATGWAATGVVNYSGGTVCMLLHALRHLDLGTLCWIKVGEDPTTTLPAEWLDELHPLEQLARIAE